MDPHPADFPEPPPQPRITLRSDTVDSSVFHDDDNLFSMDDAVEQPDSFDAVPPNSYPSPNSSLSTSYSGGDILSMASPPLPVTRITERTQTAGEVIRTYNPSPEKRDHEVSYDELLEEDMKFSAEGVSDSVKHFYGAAIPVTCDDRVDTGAGYDTVDAGADYGSDAGPDNSDTGPPLPYKQKSKVIEPEAIAVNREFQYPMNHKQRGCCIIFNQKHFDAHLRMDTREGTNHDAENIKHSMEMLGFEHVRIIKDSTKVEIINWIAAVSKADHSNYDCFACVILTHGGDKDVLYARDDKMELKDFMQPFRGDNCPSLATKPKLFFIQACRGFKLAEPVKVRPVQCDSLNYDTTDGGSATVDEFATIPAEADFLIAQSTVPKYYSWRNKSNGSIFIQALCLTFNLFGEKQEIMQMMTKVNRMVAYDYESASKDPKMNQKKQIPSITTQLTAELYFPKKREGHPSASEYSVNQQVTSPRQLQHNQVTARCEYDQYSSHTVRASDNAFVETTTQFSRLAMQAGDASRLEEAYMDPRTQGAAANPPSHASVRQRDLFPRPPPLPTKQRQTRRSNDSSHRRSGDYTTRRPPQEVYSSPTGSPRDVTPHYVTGYDAPPRRSSHETSPYGSQHNVARRRPSYETSFPAGSRAIPAVTLRKQSLPVSSMYSSSADSHLLTPNRHLHPSETVPARLSVSPNAARNSVNRRSLPLGTDPKPQAVSSWGSGINRAGLRSTKQTEV
nr:uncharacterized protein LOC100178691 [Ciona intestinalis]|eukprot:XP_002131546.1 uncharacterized protein LOC100178691 [Ciona intestinalis]